MVVHEDKRALKRTPWLVIATSVIVAAGGVAAAEPDDLQIWMRWRDAPDAGSSPAGGPMVARKLEAVLPPASGTG